MSQCEYEIVNAAEARAAIATAMLGTHPVVDAQLGSISLRPRQRVAAERLLALIREQGAAMLAEPVGLGKTYTALAVAASAGGQLTILAPSALRAMWTDALAACHLHGAIVTHEALSRGMVPIREGFLIVDEAHRFRSPTSHRYARLANALRGSRLLLVTATPIQNHRDDLAAQLALFLGRRAQSMTDDQLAAFVVRVAADDSSAVGLPALRGPTSITLQVDDDACLDRILALPPPVLARGETLAESLLTYGLVHQWSSSRAALLAAVRRRRVRGLALLDALRAGRQPSRAELTAWTQHGDAMQLAFPELVVTQVANDLTDVGALSLAIGRHTAALEALLSHCRQSPDPDDERAAALARIVAQHPGERVIAFCHYAETVDALRRRLSPSMRVAALTARGATVATGRVSRRDVLEQFTPHHRSVSAHEHIDLLVATDLLSEGLDLQEASVVVHLDLPWNPARLDQRVGRVRRLGSRHASVAVYAFAPPAPADRVLHIRDRLRAKLHVAQRTIGVAGHILPDVLPDVFGGAAITRSSGVAELAGAIDRRLRTWWKRSLQLVDAPAPVVVAGVRATPGFLAAVRDGDGWRLLADLGDGIIDAPQSVTVALERAEMPDTVPDQETITSIMQRLHAHLAAHHAAEAIDFAAAASARARRATLTRVAETMARVPRHRQAALAPLADAARAVAVAPLGEGAERVLEILAKAQLPDETWLETVATFAQLNTRPQRAPARSGNASGDARVVALIVFHGVPVDTAPIFPVDP